jgi:hypothetical protein
MSEDQFARVVEILAEMLADSLKLRGIPLQRDS